MSFIKEFCEFLKDIIPSDSLYDSIIHYNKKPNIIDNVLYNRVCEKNEKIYIDIFLKSLHFCE